jgi:stage II sporulation protein D (peptidoglycan lytic transglycosylase)
MRRLGMTVMLLGCGCGAPHVVPGRGNMAAPRATISVLLDDEVTSVPLEEYVRAVILSEFAPRSADDSAVEPMLEVQAIVSRTFALAPRHRGEGFDLCATTHCQLYDPARAATSRWAEPAAEAVRRTTGVVVWFGNAPARTVFHADCGGHTSAAHDVWSGDDPSYLAGVSDGGPAASAHGEWRFSPAGPTLLAALNADARTRVGARLDRIDVLARDGAGRALLVGLDGERSPLVRGEELRAIVTRAFGARALRSTRFDVVRGDGRFEFRGRGFGHGVGLCQVGAFARIAAGASPEEVLAYYFPGTSIR